MLLLYKCSMCKLLIIITYIYIYYNVLFSIFIKSNYNENIFWYFVEILNNNNKSILLFLSILLVSILIIIKNNLIYNKIINILTLLNVVLLFEYKFNLNLFIRHTLTNYTPNTTLINGVVLVHPFLIYITYAILILFIFFYKLDIKIFNKVLFFIKLYKQKLFLFSFLALFLGGWWAQQELNWGGWWNWDFVEIIALIFNILTIYIIHTNFYKKYNFLFNIIKNIIFYLIFFFLFIRFDVLNSIHAFNSFSILNNFNNLLYIIIYCLVILVLYFIFYYKNKFNNNNHSSNVISYFFKATNSIFLIYIFANLFFILYLNYQFVDITKYIKYILLVLLYILVFVEFLKFIRTSFIIPILLLSFFLKNINVFHFFDLLIILNIVFLNKNIIKFNKYIIIPHYLFIVFIFYIRYNNIYIYYYNDYHIYLNEYFYKNFLIESIKPIIFYDNNNSIYFPNLINYYYNINQNSNYYNNIIYVNNIVCNNNVICYYNLDKFLNLFFYKLNILYYMILAITITF